MDTTRDAAQGYCLLQQYMERHPDALASAIVSALRAGGVVWRTPPQMAPTPRPEEAGAAPPRWHNLDFLGQGQARRAWAEFWPQEGHRFAWDAIGKVQMGRVGWEWLLVSAYAHPGELSQGAPSDRADERIAAAIAAAQARYQVAPGSDWLRSDHYLGVRLSALSFLRQHGACTRMINIYFYDQKAQDGAGLASPEAWLPVIAAAERRLGLTGASVLERRLYRAFLPAI